MVLRLEVSTLIPVPNLNVGVILIAAGMMQEKDRGSGAEVRLESLISVQVGVDDNVRKLLKLYSPMFV
jgi:hypothetical protein